MAKITDPKPPDLDPGAAAPPQGPEADPPAPEAAGIDTPTPEPPSDAPEPPAELPQGERRYRVNWRFDGFRPEPLMPGDEVTATEAEAAPYAGPGGVLTAL